MQPKKKGDACGIFVGYLYDINKGYYKVIRPHIGQLITCHTQNYRPNSPQFDPKLRFAPDTA